METSVSMTDSGFIMTTTLSPVNEETASELKDLPEGNILNYQVKGYRSWIG